MGIRIQGGRLVVATHNAGKLVEIRRLLAPYGVDVTSAAELGLPEPAETETTFEGNARIKAHAAAKASGLPALADDSGLEIDALNGQPGVYTADWAETPQGRDWMLAMGRAHDALIAAGAAQPWRARFVSVLALALPDGRDAVFRGTAEGAMTWPPRGKVGFGYDPVFIPAGDTRTFAEMPIEDKEAVSHRTDAFRQLVAAVFA